MDFRAFTPTGLFIDSYEDYAYFEGTFDGRSFGLRFFFADDPYILRKGRNLRFREGRGGGIGAPGG